uniref:RNA-directed DNA polymerase n=1 Tax=Calidris pygmaea TaxID=425635 RepID=A0A8C3KF80_9CHAR
MLQQIASMITTRSTHRRVEGLPIDLTVLCGEQYLMAALTQQKIKTGEKQGSTTIVLEWIAPPLQPRQTIQEKIATLADLIRKGRCRILQVNGTPPSTIWVPIKQIDLEWYLQNSEELQAALLNDGAALVAKPLPSPILSWMENLGWIVKPMRSSQPIPQALTAFTDAGRRSRTAAVTWKDGQRWQHQILQAQQGDSLQTLELFAVVWAFIRWRNVPLNIVTDSLYVAGIANRIEDASLRELKNQRLTELLVSLQLAIAQRSNPYAVIHIQSHQWEEGLGEGNARADRLVAVTTEPPLAPHCRAREAHSIFHQNAKGLARAYKLSIAEARAIVKACPICSYHNSGLGLGCGVNPRGLKSNEVWQMDVTHVPALGRLKYLHVTVDTYSHMIWATPQPGEKVRDVRRHLASCFAVLGVPGTIKTDNGPAYRGGPLKCFMQLWNIVHLTGIPHSPTGQAVVERANGTLKCYLEKFKDIVDARERVQKALFVLNHLCVFGDGNDPPIVRHHAGSETLKPPHMKVLYKDAKTGQWVGPAEVVYVGRGYVCVSTATGTIWVPGRWVRPAIEHTDDHGHA